MAGLQAAGVVASVKASRRPRSAPVSDDPPSREDARLIPSLAEQHFIANEQETLRRPYFGVEAASSNVDDKTLHEHYLWPFMDGLRAGAGSVMCSYNRVNDTYACANDRLLNGILKTELGFPGFVLLDWNAPHDLDSANAGLDMVMPLGGAWGRNLTDGRTPWPTAPSARRG